MTPRTEEALTNGRRQVGTRGAVDLAAVAGYLRSGLMGPPTHPLALIHSNSAGCKASAALLATCSGMESLFPNREVETQLEF